MGVVYTPASGFSEATFGVGESPREMISRSKFKAQRTLICPWENRFAVAESLLTAYTITMSGVVFKIGDRYTTNADAGGGGVEVRNAYVKQISSIKPKGASTGSGENADWTGAKAILIVDYETSEFDPGTPDQTPDSNSSASEDIFNVISEQWTASTEFITLEAEHLQWEDGTKLKPDEGPGKILPMWVWTVSWKQTTPMDHSILYMDGMVNANAIYSKSMGLTFKAETMLYTEPRFSSTLFSDGTRLTEIEISFLIRPHNKADANTATWNRFFRPKTGNWQKIQNRAGAAVDVYAAEAFEDKMPFLTAAPA